MKTLTEQLDGFFMYSNQLTDGRVFNSAPFARDQTKTRTVGDAEETYNVYEDLISQGYEPVLIPQSEKDKHEQEQARATFKAERAQAVDELTIETALGVFDADERSQDRMARAVVAMGEVDTIEWVLNNNSIVTVTAEQLKEALQLAGAAQSALWTQ